MNKNEYRRAFIMLRASLPGYAGHVRLEQRTMMGSMYFTATPVEDVGELQAVLAGQSGGQYYAASLGALRRDRRGQASLAYSFDPRDISGRPMDAYRWIVIARTGPNGCEIALTGNVNGSYPIQQGALRDAVCALFADAAPADDLPARGEAPSVSAPVLPRQSEPVVPQVQAAPATEEIPPVGAVPAVEPPSVASESLCEAVAETEGTGDTTSPAADALTAGPSEGHARVLTSAAPPEAPAGASEPAVVSSAEPTGSAARQLGLDAAQPWSSALEPLRTLFREQSPVTLPLDGEFVYVRAPMPEGCGYAACLAGLWVEDGQVVAARYALPGRYTPEPPAGLEDYQWLGGTGDGFWVLTVDPDTGAPMHALDYAQCAVTN